MNYTDANPPTDPQNNPKSKAVAIIPARYDSVRLPGKALLEIEGKPMICWVAERAAAVRNVARVIVATDDRRIVDAVQSCGHEAVTTRSDHKSGTDRIAEVAAGLPEFDVVVNVQGDEPFISAETIEHAVDAIEERGTGQEGKSQVGIVTTWEPVESAAAVVNPDLVKVVVDENEDAVYFSRSPVPYPRDAVRRHGTIEAALRKEPSLLETFRKHTGLYVYRRDVLLEFTKWPQTELERTEQLEQLRALEHGVRIKVIKASGSSIGVDTVEDLKRVRELAGVQVV